MYRNPSNITHAGKNLAKAETKKNVRKSPSRSFSAVRDIDDQKIVKTPLSLSLNFIGSNKKISKYQRLSAQVYSLEGGANLGCPGLFLFTDDLAKLHEIIREVV